MKKLILFFTALLLFALITPFNKLEAQQSTQFITTWQTTAANESITIPVNTSVTGYNYTVYWGDGSTPTTKTSATDAKHTYAAAGTHTVYIAGTFPAINFNSSSSDGTNDAKILTIKQWGTQVWKGMNTAFKGCYNLTTESPTDAPIFAANSSLNEMFYGCNSFNSDLNDWDMSKVTGTSHMFEMAIIFNGNITSWNTSNVTDMSYMFKGASAFNQNIGNWDVSKVTNMYYMLSGCYFFNQNLDNWDVSNVTNMFGMFMGCNKFNGNIGNWNVGKVTSTNRMFSYDYAFNQDIGNWNVGSVTDMEQMFFLTAFDQNIGNWNVSNVTNMSGMFAGVTLSTANYDALLNGWNALTLQNTVTFSGGNSKYCTGKGPRQNIIDNYGWSISDKGWEGAVCGNVPIVLIDFKAHANPNNNSVLLTWATLSESNNDYFTIERSKDGVAFEGVNNVPSAGNSNSRVDYASTDTHPFDGYSYYRLKQTDKDGKFTYSQIEKVYFGSQSFSATVSPNPTRNVVQLKIDGAITKGLQYTITDMIGKRLENGIINTNTTSIDLGNRAQGTYILQVIDEGKMLQSFKIIKTN